MGGTHRTVDPAATLARVRRFMPVMGITRLADITGLDRVGIPVVVAIRPNSRSLSVSQGKGLDLVASQVSALMESVEAYHAERITLPLKLGSLEDLAYTHALADVGGLPRAAASELHPHLQLLWIEGWDILGDRPLWTPYELVHTRYTHPKPSGAGCFNASSNGLASGNHLLEAISHALCEVIERDATTLWHLLSAEAQAATRVDLASVDDPGCRELLGRFARAGIDVAVWETTSDVGVPAFMCIISEGEGEAPALHSAGGMGCHPARAVALARALTEAAQSRLTVISGSRDDIFRSDYDTSRSPENLRRDRTLIRGEAGGRPFPGGPSRLCGSVDEDLEWILARLRAIGVDQVICFDLSRPEFGIPVARVVVPGLEGLCTAAGYAAGARARARAAAAEEASA